MPTSPRSPPTRRRSVSPSIVWVLMISRSSGVSAAGLLMISPGILILPTSWRRAANSALRRDRCVEADLVADGEHEVDDLAAVGAGVFVVGFDDVAEQERGAPVGGRELERPGRAGLCAHARRSRSARGGAAARRPPRS